MSQGGRALHPDKTSHPFHHPDLDRCHDMALLRRLSELCQILEDLRGDLLCSTEDPFQPECFTSTAKPNRRTDFTAPAADS
jgi:hypothetical protein